MLELVYIPEQAVDNEATGREARQLRERFHLQLNKVARHMKFSAAFVSDLERGRRNWNQKLVDKYNRAVGRLTTRRPKL